MEEWREGQGASYRGSVWVLLQPRTPSLSSWAPEGAQLKVTRGGARCRSGVRCSSASEK